MDKLSLWAVDAYKKNHFLYNKYRGNVPEEWLAGINSVENARNLPTAKRFEQTVYQSVMFVKQGNRSNSFPAFNNGPIHDLIVKTNNIDILKSIATSYGHGQLMGYNYITHLGWGPEIYQNLSYEQSIQALCKFANDIYGNLVFPNLVKNNRIYKPYEQLLRTWNSGSKTGQTFDPNYVSKATGMADAYKLVMDSNSKVAEAQTEQGDPFSDETV